MEKLSLYKPKNYSYLLGTKGFSDTLLNNHFKLYEGYVKNLNLLIEKINMLLSEGKDRDPEFAELKRRLGWEFNGMRLHEYYFGNIGGQKPLEEKTSLYTKITQDFGSFSLWKQEFISCGVMRGIGWVILYLDTQTGRLINTWINEHDVGHLSGSRPILIMDVFEHAYILDYQLDRLKYIEAFFNVIDWRVVEERLSFKG